MSHRTGVTVKTDCRCNSIHCHIVDLGTSRPTLEIDREEAKEIVDMHYTCTFEGASGAPKLLARILEAWPELEDRS